MSETGFPRIEAYLTDVMDFAATLAQDLDSGRIGSWPVMAERVRDFFTPEKLDDVEGLIPGWCQMSSYADGITLVHVMSAVAALFLCPEYQAAPEPQQALLKWIVLLHDVSRPQASSPETELSGNTTGNLIADIELLRVHLNVER